MTTGKQVAAGESQATTPLTPRPFRRRLGWVMRGGAGLFVVLVLGVAAIRSYNMWGLPDAPEPFDVKAFEDEVVPDSENAFTLYHQAHGMLTSKVPVLTSGKGRPSGPEWADVSPESRAWIDRNLPAIEVWRKGTERSLLRFPTSAAPPSNDLTMNDLYGFSHIALLHSSRLEDAGDYSGAWQWHKARLRMWLQFTRRQSASDLNRISYTFYRFSKRAQTWSDLAGVTVPQLRAAMADLEAMQSLHGKRSDSLKSEYIALSREVDEYVNPRGSAGEDGGSVGSLVYLDPLLPWIKRGKYLVIAEPDRTRRTMRLLFANWLGEADKDPAERRSEFSKSPLVFATAPGEKPLISDRDLAWHAWNSPLLLGFREANDPKRTLMPAIDDWPIMVDAVRRPIADMIVSFASRIYELETGAWPDSPKKLVGPVLKKLPDYFVPIASESK